MAIVIDLFTRKIVGHSRHSSLHAEIVLNALDMGIKRQLLGEDLVTHTDRGSQYASERYRNLLEENRIKASMSRKGNCYDNAFVESFFHTLKVELVHRESFKTREEAKSAILNLLKFGTKDRESTLLLITKLQWSMKLLI